MKNEYCKFKDISLLGGFLTIMWKPHLVIWWTNDGAPPDHLNKGFWIFGKRKRGLIP